MTDPDAGRVRARFDDSTAVIAAFESLPCDAIVVNETRAVVVYRDAVLTVDVLAGTLDGTRTLSVAVWERPRTVDPSAFDATALTTDLVDRLATVVEPALEGLTEAGRT